MADLKKGLYIVSTPIGNLDDITIRAINILKESNFIICENPKHSLKLLNKLGIKKKLFSIHDYNEENLIKRIEKFQINSIVALISDSGSPLISDPGFKLVNNYIQKNIFVTSIPGASSIIPSIKLSGLSVSNFTFFGFVPKGKSTSEALAEKVIKTESTSIVFVSGKNLFYFLNLIAKHNLDANLGVCKELTKLNEVIFRDTAGNIQKKILNKEINLKGEFVLVIEGVKTKPKQSLDISVENKTKRLLEKFTLTEAVEIVHKLTNISKKEVYKMALKLKND